MHLEEALNGASKVHIDDVAGPLLTVTFLGFRYFLELSRPCDHFCVVVLLQRVILRLFTASKVNLWQS